MMPRTGGASRIPVWRNRERPDRAPTLSNKRLVLRLRRPGFAGYGLAGPGDRSGCADAAGGPARNSVYGRAVEPQPAMAWEKRSPKRTANWTLAIAHSRGGILHSFSARFKTRNSSF